MNKFFVSTLAVAALTAGAVASQATQLTYELLTGTTAFTTGTGIAPTSADPAMPGSTFNAGITNTFTNVTPNPVTETTPSELIIGQDVTFPGTITPAGTTAYFNMAPVTFQFKIDTGSSITASAHLFDVTGYLEGGLGYGPLPGGNPYSNAKLVLTSITDTDNALNPVSFASTNPGDGLPSLELDTTINGEFVDVWVNTPLGKPIPGSTQTLNGYIANGSAVPEPGSVAMIIGAGISGGMFLRRKRRA